MKVNYREVKTWECENSDGSNVVIFKDDRVRVEYDVTKNAFSKEFRERHPDNVVVIDITWLSKNKIYGTEVSEGGCVEIELNQIVSIEKLMKEDVSVLETR